MLCCPVFTISFYVITRLEKIFGYNFRQKHFIAFLTIGKLWLLILFIGIHNVTFSSKIELLLYFCFYQQRCQWSSNSVASNEDCRLAARISPREGFNQSTVNYNSTVYLNMDIGFLSNGCVYTSQVESRIQRSRLWPRIGFSRTGSSLGQRQKWSRPRPRTKDTIFLNYARQTFHNF